MYEELVKKLRSHNGWALNETLDEAADAIEKLSKILDAVNDAHNEGYDVGYWAGRRDYEPKWIPVTERLPDMNDYDWVLGVVSGKFGYTVFQNAVICVGYDPDFGFFLEEYPDVEITVTHWMPLPEPPKEE